MMNSPLQRNHQTFPPQWPSCVCCTYICCYCLLSHCRTFYPELWFDVTRLPPTVQRRTRGRGVQRPRCKYGAHGAHVRTSHYNMKAFGGCIRYSGVQTLDRTMTDHYVPCWLDLSRVQQSSSYYGAWIVELSPPSCSRPSPPLTSYHQQWEKNVIITQFCWFVSKGWDVCYNFFGYDDCYNSVSNVGLLVRLFNARISFLQLGRQDKTSLETSHITIHGTFVSEAPWCC